MLSREIRRIMKENEKYIRMLEEYDRTGELPIQKIRRSFTLKRMTINKLKATSKKTGKSMSDIIDNLVDKNLN
ncbi:hypothetical protein HY501_02380 [Candidatus Woesearchaeota archaeon]|nr:hypothetical protein [Candidatus Woesearchaeota archaeon]